MTSRGVGDGSDFVHRIVQERRNLREGISSTSEQDFSSFAELWHRESWVTVRILCTVLNSKTANATTWACTCLASFFLIFYDGSMLQHSWSTLLLVAFAFADRFFTVSRRSTKLKTDVHPTKNREYKSGGI